MVLFLIIVSLVLVLWVVFTFNRLVRLRNQVRAGWSDIDVQLMRRHDLVPRLVEAVRAYAGHEKAVLENVTELRAQANDARPLPPALAAMHAELAQDFPPVIEDRALEGELRLCLQRIAAQHWRLHA